MVDLAVTVVACLPRLPLPTIVQRAGERQAVTMPRRGERAQTPSREAEPVTNHPAEDEIAAAAEAPTHSLETDPVTDHPAEDDIGETAAAGVRLARALVRPMN